MTLPVIAYFFNLLKPNLGGTIASCVLIYSRDIFILPNLYLSKGLLLPLCSPAGTVFDLRSSIVGWPGGGFQYNSLGIFFWGGMQMNSRHIGSPKIFRHLWDYDIFSSNHLCLSLCLPSVRAACLALYIPVAFLSSDYYLPELFSPVIQTFSTLPLDANFKCKICINALRTRVCSGRNGAIALKRVFTNIGVLMTINLVIISGQLSEIWTQNILRGPVTTGNKKGSISRQSKSYM